MGENGYTKAAAAVVPRLQSVMERLAAAKQLPMLEKLDSLGLTLEDIGDGEFQQKALESMYMEMVLDKERVEIPLGKGKTTVRGFRASDRIAAGKELARLKGYGKEEQQKRVLEQIAAFRKALKPKLIEAKVLPDEET